MAVYDVDKLTEQARLLAQEYRQATGKVLPITAEIAINDAIRILDLEPAESGTQGYDATMQSEQGPLKVQIKGRSLLNESSSNQRLGQLKLDQDWDAILLVVMNDAFQAEEIYCCQREDIEQALNNATPNKRGSMTLAKFRIIANLTWTLENGIEQEIWDNQS